MWDEIVDVVAVGAGPGGLACAVAAVDAELDVFVAHPGIRADRPSPSPADTGVLRGWLPVVDDADTMSYFDALAEEIPSAALPGDPAALQIQSLDMVPVDTSRRARVETFFGSQLGTWAARCLASPYGVLFTRVDHWPAVAMRANNGRSFQVAALDESPGVAADATFAERMDALVAAREIEIYDDHPLQRIVFEEGRIAGVVVDSADGPWAVRARLGIAVTTGQAYEKDTRALDAGSRLSLVGLTASRFGRLDVVNGV